MTAARRSPSPKPSRGCTSRAPTSTGQPALTGGRRVDLPTYPFRRELFWPPATRTGGDATSLGLGAPGHPLLDGTVRLAGSDEVVLTSRLSLHTQPWLAEHVVYGQVLLPGTALAEMAIRAGDETGCPRIDELTMAVPLVVPPQGGVQVQVRVGEPDARGRRPVGIHSRTADAWTEHATGTLSPATPVSTVSDSDTTAWPPPDAIPVPLDDFYESFAADGFDYGPRFRGLRAAWRSGDDVFAEVELDPAHHAEAAGFGLHPALLDAALHAVTLRPGAPAARELPFSWQGFSLHAAGAVALRVRVTPGIGLELTTADGDPVATIDSLVVREAGRDAVRRNDSLFQLDWTPVPIPDATSLSVALLGDDPLGIGVAALDDRADAPDVVVTCLTGDAADVPGSAADLADRALELAQRWITDDRYADAKLIFVTREGDLPAAAVWGLVRAAQAEHPGRFGLLELDGSTLPCGRVRDRRTAGRAA